MRSIWILYRWIFKYTWFLINIVEYFLLQKYGKQPSVYPTVYIIGPPRTGSTILYQLITNYLDVLYIDNLANLARKNLFFGICLSQRKFKNSPHNIFSSKYGKTLDKGLHAPNEGLFWYRYLPKNKHFLKSNEVSQKAMNKIAKYHTAIKNKFRKPLIIKNLSFGMRLDLIRTMEPDARIIFIKRNIEDTIKSIYVARIKLNWAQNKLWSIMPKNYTCLEKMPLIEQIYMQITEIIKQIEQDSIFFGKNFVEVEYEKLTDQPNTILKEIAGLIGCRSANLSNIPKLKRTSSDIVSIEIIKEIQKVINENKIQE